MVLEVDTRILKIKFNEKIEKPTDIFYRFGEYPLEFTIKILGVQFKYIFFCFLHTEIKTKATA